MKLYQPMTGAVTVKLLAIMQQTLRVCMLPRGTETESAFTSMCCSLLG